MLAKVTQIVLMVMMLAAPITEASAARRDKRESAEKDVDVNREDVREAANAAAVDLSRRFPVSHRVVIDRIIKATAQIVPRTTYRLAGTMFRITVDLSFLFYDNGNPIGRRCTLKVLHQPRRAMPYTLEEYKWED